MKNNASIVYSLFLVIGDFLALLSAFSLAYILRVKYDTRPLVEQIPAETYFYGFLAVLPLWILVQAFIGLYRRETYENRFRELGKLVVGSGLGMLVVIGYDFIINDSLFPARLVAVYGLLLSFGFLIVFRGFARLLRSTLFSYGIGLNNVLIVGNGTPTDAIVGELRHIKRSGHRIVGIVGGAPQEPFRTFETFDQAIFELKDTPIHSIIQTELYKKGDLNSAIMSYAQTHHISYRFIPGSNELFVGNIEVELFRGTPVVTVHQTALTGWGNILKRIFDIFAGSIFLILSLPFFVIVAIAVKLGDPKGPVFMRGAAQVRLTQYDRTFKVFKFRSHYARFDGKTDQQVFEMLGKPELLKEYRDNGDKLTNDFRVNPVGKFIRATSLDELPQLINVIKGDISLVGPRALIPSELNAYHKKHHILSIKSGLTGLAQVSGRRDISFEERRKLDLYYVQNWTFWLDIIILLKTLRAVINGIGSK